MKRLVQSLLGRIALVLLVAWATAAVAPLILRINLTILPLALKWASVASVGLAAGLGARGWLGQRTLALRLVTAFLSLSSGLWLSGCLTMGYVGFRLFPRSDIAVDWVGLGQLAFGCLVAWLALYAWRISPAAKLAVRKPSGRQSRSLAPSAPKPAPRKTIQSSRPARPQKSDKPHRRLPATRKRAPAPKRRQPLAAAQRSLRAGQRTFWAAPRNFWATSRTLWVRTVAVLNTRFQTSRTAGREVQVRLREAGRALQNRLHARSRTAHTQLRNRLASRSGKSIIHFQNRPRSIRSARPADSPVRLVGETEHRCPYCLEVVVRNDPRGVTVCPICHTRHHADCWAVTGMCQVPHLYE